MRDIKIKESDQEFKFRVCGIIYDNERVLVVNIHDNGFYCLPGGHVEFGENTQDAVLREMKEEVNCDFEVGKLIAIIENFYIIENRNFHEIAYYYLMNVIGDINKEDYIFIEDDHGIDTKLEFKWIHLKDLEAVNFKPSILKEQLINKDFNLKNYITKDY